VCVYVRVCLWGCVYVFYVYEERICCVREREYLYVCKRDREMVACVREGMYLFVSLCVCVREDTCVCEEISVR